MALLSDVTLVRSGSSACCCFVAGLSARGFVYKWSTSISINRIKRQDHFIGDWWDFAKMIGLSWGDEIETTDRLTI